MKAEGSVAEGRKCIFFGIQLPLQWHNQKVLTDWAIKSLITMNAECLSTASITVLVKVTPGPQERTL